MLESSDFRSLNNLRKHNLVVGLSEIEYFKNHVSLACQLGKQVRSSFKTKVVN